MAKPRLTKPQKKALPHCEANPDITPAELAEKLGCSVSGAGLILGRLKSKGVIGGGAAPEAEDAHEAPATSGEFVTALRAKLANWPDDDDTDEDVKAKISYKAKARLDSAIASVLRGEETPTPAAEATVDLAEEAPAEALGQAAESPEEAAGLPEVSDEEE